jgi:hypothetical protein
MKYLLIISALILSSCGTTSYLVDSSQCEAIGGGHFICKEKESVKELN